MVADVLDWFNNLKKSSLINQSYVPLHTFFQDGVTFILWMSFFLVTIIYDMSIYICSCPYWKCKTPFLNAHFFLALTWLDDRCKFYISNSEYLFSIYNLKFSHWHVQLQADLFCMYLSVSHYGLNLEILAPEAENQRSKRKVKLWYRAS